CKMNWRDRKQRREHPIWNENAPCRNAFAADAFVSDLGLAPLPRDACGFTSEAEMARDRGIILLGQCRVDVDPMDPADRCVCIAEFRADERQPVILRHHGICNAPGALPGEYIPSAHP